MIGFLLLDVEHHALTAWIFWGIIVCLLFSAGSLLLSLRALLQTRTVAKKPAPPKQVKAKSPTSNKPDAQPSCKIDLVMKRQRLVAEMLKPENDCKRRDYMKRIDKIDKQLTRR